MQHELTPFSPQTGDITQNFLTAGIGGEQTWVALNSLQWPRQEVAQDPNTKDLALQSVPPMGYSLVQEPADPPTPVTLSESKATLTLTAQQHLLRKVNLFEYICF